MSRSKPSGMAWEPGEVYTLHFVPAYRHAAHYTGWSAEGRAPFRLVDHALGQGARLTQVQRQAGGSWVLASVESGTRDREAQLKERGASRRCGVCRAQRAYEAGEVTASEALHQAGWDRFTVHEKNLMLGVLGLDEPPEGLAVTAPPEPPAEITIWSPGPAEMSAEQLAELDAVVDDLCAQWKAGEPEPEMEMEMEMG